MYKVLIADDEPKIRRGLKKWIEEESLPFRVCAEAENGRQALELALLHKPRLLLVDINMPHGNGLDFIRQIKSLLPDAVVIVISGYDNFEYVREAFKQEVFDYLLKPVPRSDFKRILSQVYKEVKKDRHVLSAVKPEAEKKSLLVLQVQEYIEEHYSDRELTLQRTSELYKINKAYLSRLMKQELNASFIDYLTSYRIEKAKELLLQSGNELKMYQIAEKVGFSSQHYFSRVFKNLEEISPLEFRRRH